MPMIGIFFFFKKKKKDYKLVYGKGSNGENKKIWFFTIVPVVITEKL